jgi:FixJ family two-component response regulator
MIGVPISTDPDRPRVLVVEDDPGVRRSLQLLLRGRGFEVRAYASGLALLADPTALSAICLVADYLMPDVDGIKVLVALRDLGWSGEALLITAYPTPELADRALKAGFARVLEKPLIDAALVEIIAGLAGRAVGSSV